MEISYRSQPVLREAKTPVALRGNKQRSDQIGPGGDGLEPDFGRHGMNSPGVA
jgi:hypothetical protein